MEWFAYKEDFNRQSIERFDVITGRYKTLKRIKRKAKDYDDFCESLRHEMMWEYWSRCEYELILCVTDDNRIILKPWINPKDVDISLDVTDDNNFDWQGFASQHLEDTCKREVKIDVFSQLSFRWDDFCTYCWNATLKGHSSEGGFYECS